jgi:lipopolysaccharide assembly protein A
MMRIIAWIVRLALFLVVLGFAVKNTEPVTVRFYFGSQWQSPLVFALLIAFIVGAAAGVAATLGYVFRQRREMLQLRKQVRAQAAQEPHTTVVR